MFWGSSFEDIDVGDISGVEMLVQELFVSCVARACAVTYANATGACLGVDDGFSYPEKRFFDSWFHRESIHLIPKLQPRRPH